LSYQSAIAILRCMNCCKFSLLRKLHRQDHSDSGFTIVELLVVIVVIGILAAITIVSYTGVSQKAVLASLQSDLSGSAQKLKMYQVEHGVYPAALDSNNCPTSPADAQYCLKHSFGNTLTYSSSTPYSTFSLIATNINGISYQVTGNSQPTVLAAAPLNPVADWVATAQGDHYGNYYDLVNRGWAGVTRSTSKTIYDPNDGRIHDVPADYLALNPWSAYQSGGRGSAAVIEEARKNSLKNSYFSEGNFAGVATSWASVGGAGTNEVVPGGVYGTMCQRISSPSALASQNYGFAQVGIAAVAGETWTGSVYTKSTYLPTGSWLRVFVQAYDAGNVWIGEVSANVPVSASSFVRVSATYSNLPANTASVRLYAYARTGVTASGGIELSFSAAQLEKGAFATSYIPTTTAAAIRNADVVTVPTTGWNAAAGTLAAVAGTPGNLSNNSYLADWGPVSDHVTMFAIGGTYGRAYGRTVSGDGVYVSSDANPGNPYSVRVMTWQNGGNVVTYADGAAGTPGSGVTTPVGLPAIANVGSHFGTVVFFNGPIQRLAVYSSAFSSSDVTTVTNAVKNGP